VTTSYEQQLGARVAAQSRACIGCNDCLLACPIAESRSVTIAELNRAVRLPVIDAPHVAAFLNACTQCKQCVPACPADLDRSEMVLFNKLKVEDAVPNHELSLQDGAHVRPSGFSLDGLAQGLAALELFRGAPVAALRRLVQKSTLRRVAAGETLYGDGDFYGRLAVVLSGSLVVTSTGPRGEQLYLVTLGPGSFAGEVGVLGDSPEAFGTLGREPSIVLESPKLAVLKLMEQAPSFAATLDGLYARHGLQHHLKGGGLGRVSDAAIGALFETARLELVSAGDPLFAQGDAPTDFFLVKNGFLRAARSDAAGERVLTYFHEGDVVGLGALLGRESAQGYGCRAVGRAEVVRLSGAVLGGLFARFPELFGALAEAAETERLARSRDVGVSPLAFDPRGSYSGSHSLTPGAPSYAPSYPPGTPSSHSSAPSLPRSSGYERMSQERSLSGARAPLEAGVLVEEGIAKGREVLVVDQNLCTGCGNCIDACERRHGTSRLQLRGLQVDHYMFPSACRHCADPACLLCSVNGIVRLPSGEIQIVEDNCIGCGACAERCPYGNISMHDVNEKPRGFFLSLFDFLAHGVRRERALDTLDPKVERIAVKCDLCAGYGDHACVTACPVGANFRLDPADLVTARGKS
jgi:Fe-S-cluster-containing hydrogenase component 2/CRP-like cAMP-binding protein